jgi:NAD(P)-dependent dehydrogenase (short-subunit alcohol dehydrogenase family)
MLFRRQLTDKRTRSPAHPVGSAGDARVIPGGTRGTSDEVTTVAPFLMGPDGAFITGSDVLMDGGTTASCSFDDLAPP